MYHVLTLAEMTSFLDSRPDLSPAVKAKILSGDSCTGTKNKIFAVQAYANARWKEVKYKMGLPVATVAAAPAPARAPSTSAIVSRAKATPEVSYLCNGATLTVSQIRVKLANDDLDSEDIIVRVGGDGDELRIREVDELIRRDPPAQRLQRSVAAVPPHTAAASPSLRVLPPSRIVAASRRAYCAELERAEDEASEAPRSQRAPKHPASAGRSSQQSRISANANAAARRAATEHDDGPEAA